MAAGLYLLVMSVSGSVLVYRNELEASGNPQSRVVGAVEWLVDLHENLLFGRTGRFVNGIGAISLTLLCLTGAILWWPGVLHWRRSLSVNWKSSFARINWDLHNALGFWCFLFVSIWGVSGIYFGFPETFSQLTGFFEWPETSGKPQFADVALFWLSNLHLADSTGLPRRFGLS